MAEQATKEPTMEEILASIRRIISEDGSPVGEASGADVSADGGNDDFLALEDDLVDASVGETDLAEATDGHLLSVNELLESEAGFDEIDALTNLDEHDGAPEADNDPLEEVFAADELDSTVAEIEADVLGENEPDADAGAKIDPNVAADEEIEALLNSSDETDMTEPAQSAPVDAGAGAPAAAALGLAAGGATIEGLVSELMKPMIKEWIDSNLSGIVERKVEAEIQLVANKVVAALRDG